MSNNSSRVVIFAFLFFPHSPSKLLSSSSDSDSDSDDSEDDDECCLREIVFPPRPTGPVPLSRVLLDDDLCLLGLDLGGTVVFAFFLGGVLGILDDVFAMMV